MTGQQVKQLISGLMIILKTSSNHWNTRTNLLQIGKEIPEILPLTSVRSMKVPVESQKMCLSMRPIITKVVKAMMTLASSTR